MGGRMTQQEMTSPMRLDTDKTRQTLRNFDFKTLFIDLLGWDRHSASHEVTIDEKKFCLRAVAQKHGVVAFLCETSANGSSPDYQMRRRIETMVEKSHHEHLIVFVDEKAGNQIWQWVKREIGKPLATREHVYHRSQPGDALIQKLQNLAFSIEDEENLTIVDVTGRLRGFDVERVTKRFYDQFKTEHAGFTKFIQGIPDESLQSWYASFMLDRLMFIYFVQKKNFLDGDPDYLRNKLEQSRKRGPNRYYREFLCCLFFEGFAKRERDRSAATRQLLGKVPYLNGGLFLPHQIEERYGDRICIADTAFVKLYDFFGQWHWHLDDRPLRNDREINPDVLGYIFEKYVNQKQMGAYYTKEDITEYIGKNTIIPFIFDNICRDAPAGRPYDDTKSIWRLLREDPDRYIYEAVKKGVRLPLPDNIAAGITEVPKRSDWNKPAAEEYALPTEIWREVVARRQRYEEVRGKMVRGEIQSINDLITYNLNIRQFAQDVIANCDSPELLRAIYHAIESLTVLDPTCGSGAFLFAALNILEPLYEACLDRMEAFLAENASTNGKQNIDPLSGFREILTRVNEHSNRHYFILKAIIVNNLFGVDIMEEAVEICKLRLFLKLAAQAEKDDAKPNLGIEPLPDIDFNIRAGNTLVGFATREEVKDWITIGASRRDAPTGQYRMHQLLSGDTLERIEMKAQAVDDLFASFRQQQTEDSTNATPVEKKKLQKKLDELRDELNRYLAAEYGISSDQPTAYDKWLKSHKPFHWFVEFYGVMKSGGFDVIIGNPPYVEYTKTKEARSFINYRTKECGNLYGLVVERSFKILTIAGRMGMIVPLSLTFSRDFVSLRSILLELSGDLHVSSYDNIPDRLFTGDKQSENTSKANQQRISILTLQASQKKGRIYTSPILRWKATERWRLFAELPWTEATELCSSQFFPKVGSHKLKQFLQRWEAYPRRLSHLLTSHSTYALVIPKTAGYYIAAYPDKMERTQQMTLRFGRRKDRDLAMILLNSNIFFWFWRVYGDSFHVTSGLVERCPVFDPQDEEFIEIANNLYDALPTCTVYKGYRGMDVPNVNFNKRMDLLWQADQWIIRHVAPDLGISSEDFLWGKSNSFLRMAVPKSENFPEGCSITTSNDNDLC